MKIIASTGNISYLVDMTEDEIAKIAGFPYASQMPATQKPEVRREIKVSDLWNALSVSRDRHAELTKMATQLRAAATRVESINAALEKPIIEVQA